jgi:hypothetical protein
VLAPLHLPARRRIRTWTRGRLLRRTRPCPDRYPHAAGYASSTIEYARSTSTEPSDRRLTVGGVRAEAGGNRRSSPIGCFAAGWVTQGRDARPGSPPHEIEGQPHARLEWCARRSRLLRSSRSRVPSRYTGLRPWMSSTKNCPRFSVMQAWWRETVGSSSTGSDQPPAAGYSSGCDGPYGR